MRREMYELSGKTCSADTGENVFECSLCGHSFSGHHGGCEACPLNLGCDLVECPNCGYRFPRKSKLVEMARNLARFFKRGA